MVERAYLDNNATTPMRPEALAAAQRAMQITGNPSSVHADGRAVKRLVEDSRSRVAKLVGAKDNQVIFTSGATEANNLALAGFAKSHRLLVSAIEHDAVLNAGYPVEPLPVLPSGLIDLDALAQKLQETAGPCLISVMGVNNETGVIQPVEKIWQMAREHGAVSHCDAVQMAGKFPLDFDANGPDMLSLSAHKLGGPRGIGALIADAKLTLSPMIKGGGQEKNRRAGTENVAGACGFGAAAHQALLEQDLWGRIQSLRDRIEKEVRAALPDIFIAGAQAPRVATTSNIVLPGVKAETQVMALDLAGVSVSAGSACSSGKVKASHVLRAMGYAPEIAGSAIRVSLGWASQPSDVDLFLKAYLPFARQNLAEQSR